MVVGRPTISVRASSRLTLLSEMWCLPFLFLQETSFQWTSLAGAGMAFYPVRSNALRQTAARLKPPPDAVNRTLRTNACQEGVTGGNYAVLGGDPVDYSKVAFVGVDPHKFHHSAAILTCWGEVLGEAQTRNDPTDFPEFLSAILARVPKGFSLVFGLEDCYGNGRQLAMFLVQAGCTVKVVNPVLTNRERQHRPRPAKSDPVDARNIASVLIRNLASLPDARFDDTQLALAHLYRYREGVVQSLTRAKNRLHALLAQQYPGYGDWFADPAGPVALEFWQHFPSPQHLERITVAKLVEFFAERLPGSPGREKAKSILAGMYKSVPTAVSKTIAALIQYTVGEIRQLQRTAAGLEAKLERLLPAEGQILTTMPGISVVTAAGLLAEIGPVDRFTSADQLAAFAGVAPIENSSGARRKHKRTKSGRRSLHKLFYRIALYQITVQPRTRRPANPAAREYFLRKVSEGKTKRSALVCVMRRLVSVIYAMMRDKTAYRVQAVPNAIATAK